jgi:hypothetical protein
MALTGSLNGAWDDGTIQTMTEMRNDVQGQTYTGMDRTNAATDTGVITISTSSPSSPKTGEIWADTSTPSAGASTAPAVRHRTYNGSEWIGAPIYYATTAPSTVTTGNFWYDQTLEILRMYRRAEDDLHGVAGWHPVQDGNYQLWKNKSGGTVSANRVVVADTAASLERSFTTSAIHKNPAVVGVLMEEATTDGSFYVVAMATGSAYVDIYCNVTSGDITIGSGIANSGVAGEGRMVGTLGVAPNATAGIQVSGVPFGCFAQALPAATVSLAGLVPCRMLGHVGSGCNRYFAASIVAHGTTGWTDALWDGTWREIDLASPPTGSDPVTAAHKPIIGVYANVRLELSSSNGAAGDSITLELSPDASSSMITVRTPLVNVTNSFQSGGFPMLYIPTTAGTPYTSLGEFIQWKGSQSSGTATVSTSATFQSLAIVGYRY